MVKIRQSWIWRRLFEGRHEFAGIKVYGRRVIDVWFEAFGGTDEKRGGC